MICSAFGNLDGGAGTCADVEAMIPHETWIFPFAVAFLSALSSDARECTVNSDAARDDQFISLGGVLAAGFGKKASSHAAGWCTGGYVCATVAYAASASHGWLFANIHRCHPRWILVGANSLYASGKGQ